MIYKILHRKQEIALLKTGDELKYSGKVNNYCSTCGTPIVSAGTSSHMEIMLNTSICE
jgi:hypothetical protein